MQQWSWATAMVAALAGGAMLVPVLTVRSRSRWWPALLAVMLALLSAGAVRSIGAATGRSVHDIVLSSGLLSKESLDDILSPETLAGLPPQPDPPGCGPGS